MLDIVAILLFLSALFSFINERYLHLQMTIGLMLLAFLFSLFITLLHVFFTLDLAYTKFMSLILKIDFSQVVLQGVLCFLLFSGAKNISINKLEERKWDIITLSIIGTLTATFVIGSLMYLILSLIGIHVDYIYALIFGAIISPTDPIAALGILKSIGLPQNIETIIDGESQFNDGVGVVIFVTLTEIAYTHSNLSLMHVASLFIHDVLGGVGVGIVMAFITHILLCDSKSTITQVLVTLAAVSAGYAIAETVHVSGPIASVILGLVVGNISIPKIKDLKSEEHINIFWDLINQILNAVLFVLIGLVALQLGMPEKISYLCMLIAIIVVLFGRYVSVYVSITALKLEHKFNFTSRFKVTNLLTWTGLRGALAIALVLSLPDGLIKNKLLPMVYAVVVFSILVQGTTIKMLFPFEKLKQLTKSSKNNKA